MQDIDIGGRKIGDRHPPYLIAEVGINHGGDQDLCRTLIDKASAAGADAVKLQAFRAELFLSRSSPYFDLLKGCELSADVLRDMAAHARAVGVELFASVFDEPSADLMEQLGCNLYKIASGDLTHLPLLHRVASFGKPIVLSTGGGTLGEVEMALASIRSISADTPVVVLHCVSQYPTDPGDVNLRCLPTMRAQLGVHVGFSDHTQGEAVAIAAVAQGALVIEKHFTHDRGADGPDHALSCEPEELARLAEAMKTVWRALGHPQKAPVEPADFIPQIRRSATAHRAIKAGETIGENMLAVKRPGLGVAPGDLHRLVGAIAKRDIAEDETIRWEDVTPAS